MSSLDKFENNLNQILNSPEYQNAKHRATELYHSVAASNQFNIDHRLIEVGEFFSDLKQNNPEIYLILRINEKEICEIAKERKTGQKILIDID